MFILFIGETALSHIHGLSAAGADTKSLPYTAPADSDMLFYDRPKVVSALPLDPFGHPSPAIVTRACILEGEIPVKSVRAGTSVAPASPFTEITSLPGRDPRFETAVPDADAISEKAAALAPDIAARYNRVTVAESVPGGTTTALLLLRALGYTGTVSSAGPHNPLELKEKVWESVCSRLDIKVGGLKGMGLKAAAEIGDPMQVAVAAFVRALPPSVEVTLAGGTQMMAVAALLRDMGEARPLLVATTKYVRNDRTSCFVDYAGKIGVNWYAAPLDFSRSRYKGLSDYENGFIKEGVGMGGATLYAINNGSSIEKITKRTEDLYTKMTEETKQ